MSQPNLEYWEPIRDPDGNVLWHCRICKDGRPRQAWHTAKHETSAFHQALLRRREVEGPDAPSALETDPSKDPDLTLVDDALRHLLGSLSQAGITDHQPDGGQNSGPPASPPSHINWGAFEALEDTELAPSLEDQGVALIARNLLEQLDAASVNSDEEHDERLEGDIESDQQDEPVVTMFDESDLEPPRKRARNHNSEQTSRHWFPWHDKVTCTLDILMHLPRSVFSQRQLDLFLWLLKVNDVDDVPSVKSMLGLNAMLQKMCGVDSIPYKGALGHNYYVNSLAQIIAQEMANPKIRPHLHFYPEDSLGRSLSEGRQGSRWLHEIPNERLTPMARFGNSDYYIYEPAMLWDGSICMPVRWFTRVEGGHQVLYAKCWEMQPVATAAYTAWRVIKRDNLVIRQNQLLKNFPELRQDAERYSVPDPTKILDVLDGKTGICSPWTFTDPAQGNRWRALAKGHRTLAFGMWMYCDDTSGNLSKKWNEHNSYLFTPAGLSREEAQKEFNIHFLATSNIAPPLEMLDGIIDQLEHAEQNGIWAWDCETNEPVLLVPFILALLGDNPMQSEFACHIGLRGKFFCRACWVKGPDAAADANHAQEVENDSNFGSDAASDDTVEDGSEDGSAAPGKKTGKSRRRKVLESMSDMVNRVKSFVKVGKLRHKDESIDKLRSMFHEASNLDTKTKVTKMRTETGIKDTYQKVFLDKIFASYKSKRGTESKQAALDAMLTSLPTNITSPVWRIKGLDPHQDTPVEILHVVLLGFVKYLWRDLVQNQLKSKDDKKKLLATRLSSFDVSGLGISPLAGQTLVQYSGSLTGRDFRAIAQAAPFVAYDLVPKDCFETWVALSKLIPLIWQPEIQDLETHLALLDQEIKCFLLRTACWTTRWFNKPKFHILLHLTEHIRRFGPAILFATEAFESFNAIIRAKSVHSNRHAPSRDIARAFAQGNRVRHLLSGGLFLIESAKPSESQTGETGCTTGPPTPLLHFSFDKNAWKSVGAGPRSLVYSPNTVTQYLGLESKKEGKHAICISDKMPARVFDQLLTGRIFPQAIADAPQHLFKTNLEMYLNNGDKCEVGQYIIAQDPHVAGCTFVACVEEIMQIKGSHMDYIHKPDGVLLQSAAVDHAADKYQMPRVTLSNQWRLVPLDDLLCTVNVQHNCADNHCSASGVRYIYQERERTDETRPIVAHSQPTDLVLNTAQMRDALHVQKFRLPSQDLDADNVITASAAREVSLQKATRKAASHGTETGPRRTVTSQQVGQPRRLAQLQEQGGSTLQGLNGQG